MGASTTNGFELRFCSLFDPGRGYAFPCDAQGHVLVDAMSERTRCSYERVCGLVGHELAAPAVCEAREAWPAGEDAR